MAVKWDLPPEPIPSWLDPLTEITEENDAPKPPLSVLIPLIIDACLALGCNIIQALGVAANVMSEIGWHSAFRGCNLGGVKIWESSVKGYIKKYGKSPKWYRARGNKTSGDPPWCYYRAYDSIEAFIAEWLLKFVPKLGSIPPAPTRGTDPYIYRKTGIAFWNNTPWFPELIQAGYKGAVTKTRPQSSILSHESLKHEVAEWWAQSRLKSTIKDPVVRAAFVIDGSWGAKSVALCKQFEQAHGLTPDGLLEPATLEKLVTATPRA